MEQRAVRDRTLPTGGRRPREVARKVSKQRSAQRARRDRAEGRTGPARVQGERVREGERLLAQILDVMAQREVLNIELDVKAGRLLADIKALGWPPAREVAAACGMSIREVCRLRGLVQPSVVAPTLDGLTTATDARRRQRIDEE